MQHNFEGGLLYHAMRYKEKDMQYLEIKNFSCGNAWVLELLIFFGGGCFVIGAEIIMEGGCKAMRLSTFKI